MTAVPAIGDVPPTARGRRRRELILDAAMELFDRRGYHATSIDEIGSAAGITGPGVYRHFDGKEALLLAVFDRVWTLLRSALDRLDGLEPAAAFEDLVQTHITLATRQGAAVALLMRELRHVPEYYQRAADRNHARHTDAWAGVLRRLDDRIGAAEARAMALGVMGLIGSALHPVPGRRYSTEERRRLLAEMAGRAVGVINEKGAP